MNDYVAKPDYRLQDAAQAVVYTLEEWVHPHPASESPHSFAFIELTELHAWVSLLADAFPGKEEGGLDLRPNLVEVRDKLKAKLKEIEDANGRGGLCLDQWLEWIRPLRAAFDEIRRVQVLPTLCRTETCRVWTLLHILSIAGIARTSRKKPAADFPLIQNHAAFDAMTQFLRRYFTCSNCRKHFLEQVDAGAYDLAKARQGKPHDLAIWWWRLHNAVSLLVAR